MVLLYHFNYHQSYTPLCSFIHILVLAPSTLVFTNTIFRELKSNCSMCVKKHSVSAQQFINIGLVQKLVHHMYNIEKVTILFHLYFRKSLAE